MFWLEIKVEAFMTTGSAGKIPYFKSKVVKESVEVGTITFDMMVSTLSSVVSWRSNQTATFWLFDKTVGEDAMIVDDNQFQNLLEMYKLEVHCKLHLIAVDKIIL